MGTMTGSTIGTATSNTNRANTITSAVSSKRSMMSSGGGLNLNSNTNNDNPLPSAISSMGRTGGV
jgi:hypothetical protein